MCLCVCVCVCVIALFQKVSETTLCRVDVQRFKGLVVLEILLEYKCTSMYLSLSSCAVIIHLPFSTRKTLPKSIVRFAKLYNHNVLRACNASWGNSSSVRPHLLQRFWHTWFHRILSRYSPKQHSLYYFSHLVHFLSAAVLKVC